MTAVRAPRSTRAHGPGTVSTGWGDSSGAGSRAAGSCRPRAGRCRSGADRSFSRCSPRSRSPSVPSRAAVEAETRTWPPWPQAAMRAARWTSTPTYPSSAHVRRAGVDAHAHTHGAGGKTQLCVDGGLERGRRRRERRRRAHRPVCRPRPRRGCRRPGARHGGARRAPVRTRLAPSSRNRRVEPSTSVKRNVTVPEGRSCRTASSSSAVRFDATGWAVKDSNLRPWD